MARRCLRDGANAPVKRRRQLDRRARPAKPGRARIRAFTLAFGLAGLAGREPPRHARGVGSEAWLPAVVVLLIVVYSVQRWLSGRPGAAGGGHHEQWRRELGLGPDERLERSWFGVMYTGPLRPDADYSTLRVNPRILALGSSEAAGLAESTGRTCRVALTDRGRLAVSIEVSEDSDGAEQLRALAAVGSGYVPLQQFGPEPRPSVSAAEHAFGDVPGWRSALGEPPRMRGASGALVSYELLHIAGPELPAGVTLWLDPDGARHLQHWARSGGAAARAS